MPATQISIYSGNNQAQRIGAQLLNPLVAVIEDVNGLPVSSVTVNFAVDSYPVDADGMSVSAASAVSDVNGLAQVFLTLGNVDGTYTVSFTSAGLTGSPLIFTAIGIGIVSLSAVKEYLSIGISDTGNDDALIDWIGLVSELIESPGVLNQPIYPRPIEDFLDGGGDTKLFLNRARIVDLLPDPTTQNKLDSLQWRASALGAWEQMVEDIRLVYLNPINNWCVELLDYRIFPIGWKNIRVYFTGGFSPLPGDIVKMALEMVVMLYNDSKVGGQSRLGVNSKSFSSPAGGTGTDAFKNMMLTDWKAVIDKYKRLM